MRKVTDLKIRISIPFQALIDLVSVIYISFMSTGSCILKDHKYIKLCCEITAYGGVHDMSKHLKNLRVHALI